MCAPPLITILPRRMTCFAEKSVCVLTEHLGKVIVLVTSACCVLLLECCATYVLYPWQCGTIMVLCRWLALHGWSAIPHMSEFMHRSCSATPVAISHRYAGRHHGGHSCMATQGPAQWMILQCCKGRCPCGHWLDVTV